MSKKPKAIPSQSQPWIEARRRHRLPHAHVQMARELGLNPKKLSSISNHDQEPWKLPLPEFIEHLCAKRFGRERRRRRPNGRAPVRRGEPANPLATTRTDRSQSRRRDSHSPRP